MQNNGGADYGKATYVTNAQVDFTGSYGDFKRGTGAGFIISGALDAATKIHCNGVQLAGNTFISGQFYPIAVEYVTVTTTDHVYVFER